MAKDSEKEKREKLLGIMEDSARGLLYEIQQEGYFSEEVFFFQEICSLKVEVEFDSPQAELNLTVGLVGGEFSQTIVMPPVKVEKFNFVEVTE